MNRAIRHGLGGIDNSLANLMGKNMNVPPVTSPSSINIPNLLLREQAETIDGAPESMENWPFSGLKSQVPELHAVLDETLARIPKMLRHQIVTRPCKTGLFIRMDEMVLGRAVHLILRALQDINGDSRCNRLLISTRTCLRGYGAALELIQDGAPLPRRLLFQLSQMQSTPIRDILGWPLLVARDLVETHGGRLLVQSPPRGSKTGAVLRLFLPLSTSQHSVAGSSEREVCHVAI